VHALYERSGFNLEGCFGAIVGVETATLMREAKDLKGEAKDLREENKRLRRRLRSHDGRRKSDADARRIRIRVTAKARSAAGRRDGAAQETAGGGGAPPLHGADASRIANGHWANQGGGTWEGGAQYRGTETLIRRHTTGTLGRGASDSEEPTMDFGEAVREHKKRPHG
jgi:hypothetical protein